MSASHHAFLTENVGVSGSNAMSVGVQHRRFRLGSLLHIQGENRQTFVSQCADVHCRALQLQG